MWIFDCAGGAFGTPASMVSKGQLSFQEIQGSARTPTAQAMDFSRAQDFPGSWWPAPRSRHACTVIPRDRDCRFGGFAGACPGNVRKHARHLTPHYIELNVFMTFCPAAPLYSHRARILCRFKEIKLSSLPAARECCLAYG